MSEPRIMIAVPMLDKVDSNFLTSLVGLKGVGTTKLAVQRGSLVYNARGNLALRAINEDYEYILWLDSDMVFAPDTLEMLWEDAQGGKDFVSGLYFKRTLPTKPLICKSVTWSRDSETGMIDHGVDIMEDYPKDSVFEIAACGFGCALIKTELIANIAAACTMSPFEPLPGLGEDYSFCWRAGKMGIKMYCDSRVKPGHMGTFLYNEETWLEQIKGESK